MQKRIYLDNAATTCLDERLLAVILPLYCKQFGNSSSLHSYGVEAKNVLNHAHEQLAGYIGASPEELIFTSGELSRIILQSRELHLPTGIRETILLFLP